MTLTKTQNKHEEVCQCYTHRKDKRTTRSYANTLTHTFSKHFMVVTEEPKLILLKNTYILSAKIIEIPSLWKISALYTAE